MDSLSVACLPRQQASLLQTANSPATPVGTASFFINANVHFSPVILVL